MQAWKSSILNAKAQLSHQENRVMNAEVFEGGLSGLWLSQNSVVEQITTSFNLQTEQLNKQIRDINRSRQLMQERAYPELTKLVQRRDSAVHRKMLCQKAYGDLNIQLFKQGINAPQQLEERKIQASIVIDANDATHNSTVREYETVNSTSDVADISAASENNMDDNRSVQELAPLHVMTAEENEENANDNSSRKKRKN